MFPWKRSLYMYTRSYFSLSCSSIFKLFFVRMFWRNSGVDELDCLNGTSPGQWIRGGESEYDDAPHVLHSAESFQAVGRVREEQVPAEVRKQPPSSYARERQHGTDTCHESHTNEYSVEQQSPRAEHHSTPETKKTRKRRRPGEGGGREKGGGRKRKKKLVVLSSTTI